MKLLAKLMAAIILGISLLLLIDGYFSVKHDLFLYEQDVRHDVQLLGKTMEVMVGDVWHSRGAKRALQLLQSINNANSTVCMRWLWLDHIPNLQMQKAKLNALINKQQVSFTRWNKDGEGCFYLYIPITIKNRPGVLEISEKFSRLSQYTRNVIKRTCILLGTTILVSSFVMLILGIRMVGQPLNRLIEKVRRIGNGDLSGPIELSKNDELAELAQALNVMCEQLAAANNQVRAETAARISALEQLRHEDRIRTVGRLASGIAHELGTPLNVISGRASMIATSDLPFAKIVENANVIKKQSDRITKIVRQLLDFARHSYSHKQIVDLQHIINRTLELLTPLSRKQSITMSFLNSNVSAVVKVDAGQIQQVLMNIIINGIHSMPKGGSLELELWSEYVGSEQILENQQPQYVRLDVRDTGEGIPEKNIKHIFEPFFTTKDAGKGTGLGLSIADGIIREHNGWIEVASEIAKGSCFSIYLPQERETCKGEY